MGLELVAYDTSEFAVQLVGDKFDKEFYYASESPTMEFIMADDELDDNNNIDWNEMLTIAQTSPNAAVKHISEKLGIDPSEILVHPTECQIEVSKSENNLAKEGVWADFVSQECFGVSIYQDGEMEGQNYSEDQASFCLEHEYDPPSNSYKVIIEICTQRRTYNDDLILETLKTSVDKWGDSRCTLSNL